MTVKSEVIMTRDNLEGLERSVRFLTSKEVMVGIPEAASARIPTPGEEPVTNAYIGYINEFGSEPMRIPPRPHLVPGVSMAADRIVNIMRRVGRSALRGDLSGSEAGLNAAGQVAADSVRRKITQGPFVQLSEVTLRKRRARGRTGIKPLIDTGLYRRSITYVLRNR